MCQSAGPCMEGLLGSPVSLVWGGRRGKQRERQRNYVVSTAFKSLGEGQNGKKKGGNMKLDEDTHLCPNTSWIAIGGQARRLKQVKA